MIVSDVISAPNDIISVKKQPNLMCAAGRCAPKIPEKKRQNTKRSSEQSHQRTYAEVAAASE